MVAVATQDYRDTPIEPDRDDGRPDIEADVDAAPHSPHAVQRVTWAELFFDLVFVFAVTQVAHAVSVGDGWGDLGRSLLLFVPFWWAWVGCTIQFNGLVVSATRRHLLLLAIAGAAFVMSISVPDAYGDRGVLFGGAYFGARILLAVVGRIREAFRQRINPISGALVTGALWMLAGLLPAGTRQWAWLALAAVELSMPLVLGHRLDYMRFDASHLPERFGLFVIIALGETLVGIGQGGTHKALDGTEGTALFVAFILSCGLWWTYFQYGASAAEHALRVAKIPAALVRSSFSYGHLAFVVGIILAAAGMAQAVAGPAEHPHGVHALLLGSGVSLYTATFCYTRIVMFGGASYTRVIASLLAIVITVLSPGLPALAPLVMLAALVIALNAFELYWVTSGRPLMLINVGQGAAGR
ncbi:low temperature requirement protein A [Catenulispora subtropica]|uniref:Low temperature requirement protein A n=1 Tax=Catenulispora subtropica TaxID=450798 RepID=A0ABP5E8K7_9ACTN